MNRTKEYAADAIGRSTTAAAMTASVSTVLTIPSSAPDSTITTMSPGCEAWNTPPANRSAATNPSDTPSTDTSPNRRSSRCAPNTDVSATRTPQPK